MPEVALIGVGPEGPASLLTPARERIATAEVLAGGDRLLALFPEAPGERLQIGAGFREMLEEIASLCSERSAVVLASGDPLFFGIGRALVDRLGRERVAVFPQVSAVQLAFARVGESWEDARIRSVHGRPLEGLAARLRPSLKAAVLTDPRNTPAQVAAALLADGQQGWRASVCEALGTPEERVVEADLEALAGREFHPLNVLLLRREAAPAPSAFGVPDEEFDCRRPGRGLMTKREVRAVALAWLRLRPDSVVWDVGAGSGSVGIEAALLAPEGMVFAVERDAESVGRIRENASRHGVPFVRALAGEAPEALAALPDPDAVFIGGSGGHLEDILAVCCRRLRLGGRIVVGAATLETLTGARAAFPTDWTVEITQVSAARSVPVGGLTRLEGMNPVFLVCARRSGE